MKPKTCLAIFLLLILELKETYADFFGSGVNQFSIDFSDIGNPGNPGDIRFQPGTKTSSGSVAYNYRIATHEISRDMILKANAAGNLGITLQDMTSLGGNGANKPATGVSWNEAARFTNWLNTSSGGFAAYKFATSGANDRIFTWSPSDTLDYDPGNPFRSRRAIYVLPSFDEWHKAAYYLPSVTSYSDYPTGFTTPIPVASGTAPNTSVYGQTAPADIKQAGGLSAYGVMGLGGNVMEWQETTADFTNNNPLDPRNIRGGHWGPGSATQLYNSRISFTPENEVSDIGFRVVAVPEPSSMLLCCVCASIGLGTS